MTALKNEFAFSFSAFSMFRSCARKYWIAKILAWGGWENGCSKESRRAYVLGKMTFMFAHAGKIVHDLAASYVKRRAGRLDAERLAQVADSEFQRAIRESTSGGWEREPKKLTNFFEHFYPGRARSATEQRAGEAAVRGARGIASSTSIAIADAPGARVSVEKLEKATLARIPVWVQLDLMVERDGAVTIVDWKNGKPKTEDRMQLLLYTAYAVESLGFPLSAVRTRIDYLGAGAVDDVQPELGEIQAFLSGLPGAANAIRERLDGDGSIIRGPIENFPMTSDYSVCAQCEFHVLCYDQRELVAGMGGAK